MRTNTAKLALTIALLVVPVQQLGAWPGKALVETEEQSKSGAADPKAPEQPIQIPAADPPKLEPAPPAPENQDAKAQPEAPPPDVWPEEIIAAAKIRCTEILKSIDAVALSKDPVKEGECGTPAPVELVSIGKNPQVAISPPALVNCDFANAFHGWVTQTLQPLAKKHLGGHIIRINNMSSYSCRKAYGRVKNKLSEHGTANALDIGTFTLDNGKTAGVLDHWGPNHRDIAKRIEEEKAAIAKAEADKLAAEKQAQANLTKSGKADGTLPTSALPKAAGGPGGGVAKSVNTDGVPKVAVTLPGDGKTHLGGPKDKSKKSKRDKDAGDATIYFKPTKGPEVRPPLITVAVPNGSDIAPSDPRMAFLKAAHKTACELFGTTLGPEANEAHRNHFHLDMAPRKFKKVCD